jgi:hypothetical protein
VSGAYQRTTYFVERWAPLASADPASLAIPLRRAWSMYSRFMHRMDEGIGYVPGRHNLVWWSGPWETLGRNAPPPTSPIIAPQGFIVKYRFGPWPEMVLYRHQQMASSGHPAEQVRRERREHLGMYGLLDVRMAVLGGGEGSSRFPPALLAVHRDGHSLFSALPAFAAGGGEGAEVCLMQPEDVEARKCGLAD